MPPQLSRTASGVITKAATDAKDDLDQRAEQQDRPACLRASTAKPSKHEVGWRRIVRNFSPSWFVITMGTGIVAILFFTMPYNGRWMYWISIVFFCLNALLFCLATAASILRYVLYPEIWSVMIQDPNNSLYLGCVPIGLATLIDMWVFVCTPIWGEWATVLAWSFWIVDVVLAVAVTLSLSVMLVLQSHEYRSLDRFTAVQLLPIASTIVASATGAYVAEVLTIEGRALATIITGYALWGVATPLAFCVIVLYFQRLAIHKLPSREVIVSCFLPLGPLGLGGTALVQLGSVSRSTFPLTKTLDAGADDMLYVFGIFIALIMWGFGLVWLTIAVASIYSMRPFPFNMGWWGFTFPLGVYAGSTFRIGQELDLRFFRVLGEIFGVAVILLWIVVACGTIRGARSGKLFHAPCLARLSKVETPGGVEDVT